MIEGIVWFSVMLSFYLLLVNMIYLFDIEENISNITNIKNIDHSENPISAKVGYGESVTIRAEKKRWYGRFIQVNGDERLYLFSYIPIPVKVKGYNVIFFHTIYLMTLIILYYLIKRNMKVKGGKDEDEDTD